MHIKEPREFLYYVYLILTEGFYNFSCVVKSQVCEFVRLAQLGQFELILAGIYKGRITFRNVLF
jgi:hypothetical protein